LTENFRPYASIKYLGFGFSYLNLGFVITPEPEDEPFVDERRLALTRGIFRTETADERFDAWIDYVSSVTSEM
jgi:hypothetical protein